MAHTPAEPASTVIATASPLVAVAATAYVGPPSTASSGAVVVNETDWLARSMSAVVVGGVTVYSAAFTPLSVRPATVTVRSSPAMSLANEPVAPAVTSVTPPASAGSGSSRTALVVSMRRADDAGRVGPVQGGDAGDGRAASASPGSAGSSSAR